MSHHHPSDNSVATSHANAFKRWQDAHANLLLILSDYLNACACLERAVSKTMTHIEPSKLSHTLTCVDDSLSSLDLGANQLQNARKTLRHLRNRSPMLAPINCLPAEILSLIFTFARSCVLHAAVLHKSPSRFTIGSISSVCSHWRKVALDTSSLWCHIDLSVAQFQDAGLVFYAVESLKRAGSLPLHVHITGGPKTNPDYGHVVKSLAPYANRIVSLDLEINIYTAESIIRNLFSTNYRGTIRELSLKDEDSDALDQIAEFGGLLENFLSDDFLLPLTTLHLYGPLVSTPSPAFQGGLTVLVIKPCDGFFWDYSELHCALSSCPKLRSLALIELRLHREKFDGRRITFEELEALDLRGNDFKHIRTICSWIDAGSNALSLSLTIGDSEPIADLFKLQSFIKRSPVTRFCLHMDHGKAKDMNTLFSFLQESLPLTEELAFQGDSFTFYSKYLPPLKEEHFPSLHTLHLVDCSLKHNTLQHILSSSPIKKVRIMLTDLDRLARARSRLRTSEIKPSITFVQCSEVAKGKSLLEWPLDSYP